MSGLHITRLHNTLFALTVPRANLALYQPIWQQGICGGSDSQINKWLSDKLKGATLNNKNFTSLCFKYSLLIILRHFYLSNSMTISILSVGNYNFVQTSTQANDLYTDFLARMNLNFSLTLKRTCASWNISIFLSWIKLSCVWSLLWCDTTFNEKTRTRHSIIDYWQWRHLSVVARTPFHLVIISFSFPFTPLHPCSSLCVCWSWRPSHGFAQESENDVQVWIWFSHIGCAALLDMVLEPW